MQALLRRLQVSDKDAEVHEKRCKLYLKIPSGKDWVENVKDRVSAEVLSSGQSFRWLSRTERHVSEVETLLHLWLCRVEEGR